MSNDIPVKIADDNELSGSTPIVLLGPNGAGKTRHAVIMAGWNDANMIGALRNIALPPDVAMRSMAQAKQALNQHLRRRRSQPWELSSEINELFSKLMAEDSESAVRFRDEYSAGTLGMPEQTKLMQLQEIWGRLFPGRHIDFKGYHPMVRTEYGSASGEYPAQQMSDGERVALYLAGRVLDSEQKVIIVDEPEVHFHSRLGTRFWNEMEKIREDCRFVYITHDLPFALSRGEATFVIVMPNVAPRIVSIESGLPKELAESLLAAASFSIHARRIVFCEGIEGPSIDQALYTAWFKDPGTVVIPVETSKNVTRCARTFGESNFIVGVYAIGIIDRDYWPDAYLDAMPSALTVLPVHEVENLLCVKELFVAVAAHLAVTVSEASTRYETFVNRAKSKFTGGLFNKQVSERYRRRCEHEFRRALNLLPVTDDASDLQETHVAALDAKMWERSPKDIFAEETQRLETALRGSAEEFNKYFPGKVFVKDAASALGLDIQFYVDLVSSALNASDEDPLSTLGAQLRLALADYLPHRIHDNGL